MSAAVRYRIRHETVYSYGGNVAHSHQLLHLTPRDGPAQTCFAHALALTPQPSIRRDDVDAFGNFVTRLEYDMPHDRLEVLAEVGVDVRAAAPVAADDTAPWEAVRGALAFCGGALAADVLEACRFRMESSYVRIKQTFTDYSAGCFAPGRPVLAAAESLMSKIHRDFEYAPGTTTIRTSAIEAFQARRGVCQDFAHIMISGLRGLGLPAAYVSGYLRTIPPPGMPRLQGADATHAWVDLWCGKGLGWVGFDPTNALIVAGDHIVLAVGRDYADVAPMGGVVLGPGEQTIDVAVDVVPDDEIRSLEDAAWEWTRNRI
jgi:transglutaminase-like putative cysteine protease